MTILIVEDKEDSRIMLSRLLEGAGHDVKSAINGRDALNTIKTATPDLIITDILMPEIDGFELCREIRKHPHWNHIPIIIYTGTYVTPVNEQLGRALGATEYIIKPQEPDVLIKLIQKVIEDHTN